MAIPVSLREVDFPTVVNNYLCSIFGKTLAKSMLELTESKQKMKLSEVPVNQQYSFLQNMLLSVYDGFYSKKRINMICLKLFFEYARYHFESAIERAVKKPVKIKDVDLDHIIVHSAKDIAAHLNSFVTFTYAITGATQGGLILGFDERTCFLLTKFTTEAKGKKFEIDAGADKTQVGNFIQESSAGILGLINKAFNKPTTFTPIDQHAFISQYATPNHAYFIECIATKLTCSIDAKDISIDIAFVFKSNDPEVQSLVEHQQRKAKEELFNESPPRIVMKYKPEVVPNCVAFLDFVFEEGGQYITNTICKKLDINLSGPLTAADANGFISLVLGHYLETANEKKRQFVRANLEVVLGLRR